MYESFYRKVSFGLGPEDTVPSDPLKWARNQLDEVPPFIWGGKIFSEKEMRKKYGEWVYGDRKVLRKKYKNNKTKYKSEKNKLRNKTGERFFESNELTIRHYEAINGNSPVFERFWHFWGNHFAISEKDFLAEFSVGPYQREIIRPNMVNTFEQMVRDVTTSWCMIHHLDNSESVGPLSRRGIEDRETINENHARELLELHTISPEAGYSQEDVIQMTYVMTGWEHKWNQKRLETGDVWFNFKTHQPNNKTILGKEYAPDGKRELFHVIKDLVHHPNCKKFIATKLCRHFITDNPTEDMINPVIKAWEKSDGHLPEIHKAVVKQAWDYASRTRKFQQPETWALQMARIFGFYWTPEPDKMKYDFKHEPLDSQREIEWTLEELGHLPYRPAQPNGWSDFEEDWISPELMIRRLIFASKMANRGLVRDDDIIKNMIEKNFDQPEKIYELFDNQDNYKNKFAIVCNSPEMLKA
ncbi:MAG: DUF1800 family protein [Pelagibacteraceae bacterium]|jgi:uncharacterized protein (DUF1800 family)|nr:DUF1800 family protein [Pelagibacteraceae bacterium]MBO6467805.1 DUF1800 family protein [Pelagibacteraceae bacterium]MBO6479320.1 DUF1800 family protein [Pelagibacteraceae bacterium]HJO13816.1 DUF1800 family protein [Alphaproteobacteria bacterium]